MPNEEKIIHLCQTLALHWNFIQMIYSERDFQNWWEYISDEESDFVFLAQCLLNLQNSFQGENLALKDFSISKVCPEKRLKKYLSANLALVESLSKINNDIKLQAFHWEKYNKWRQVAKKILKYNFDLASLQSDENYRQQVNIFDNTFEDSFDDLIKAYRENIEEQEGCINTFLIFLMEGSSDTQNYFSELATQLEAGFENKVNIVIEKMRLFKSIILDSNKPEMKDWISLLEKKPTSSKEYALGASLKLKSAELMTLFEEAPEVEIINQRGNINTLSAFSCFLQALSGINTRDNIDKDQTLTFFMANPDILLFFEKNVEFFVQANDYWQDAQTKFTFTHSSSLFKPRMSKRVPVQHPGFSLTSQTSRR